MTNDPTKAGKVNDVPQRSVTGGYYTQEEVNAIIAFEPAWVIEQVVRAWWNATGFPRHKITELNAK